MRWHELPRNKYNRRSFIRKGKSSIATMNLLAQIIYSGLIIFFYTYYHAGGSSLSDALTPENRKTRLAGKMRNIYGRAETLKMEDSRVSSRN